MDDNQKSEQKKLLAAKAAAYKRGLDGVEIKKIGDKPKKSSTSNICKKTGKGDLLFSGIHDRTFFTGTPDADTDNLTVLRQMDSGMVDLIYLDPPFNSNRNYAAPIDSAAGDVGAFFSDMFARDDRLKLMQDEILSVNPAVFSVIHAAGKSRGASARSYLTFMATRLMEMHRVLKETGSIYLHCDPTMSHSLKLVMDAVFGAANFRNEIAWCYRTGGVSKKWFGRKHDIILFYVKNENSRYVFNPVKERSYLAHRYGFSNVEIHEDDGRYYTEIYCRDHWDIPALRGNHPESVGYPTQKPLALLRRVVKASSNPGDIVLDPFCGCGTACVAAQELNRKWIGIDAACAAGVVLVERGDMMMNRADINWRMIDKKGNGLPKRADDGATAIDLRPVKPSKAKPLTEKQRADAIDFHYERQKGLCRGCGAALNRHKAARAIEVDHIIPRSRGGGNEMKNLQLLCHACNGDKRDRTMEAFWTTRFFEDKRGVSYDGLLFIARKFGGNLGEDASG